MAFDAVVGQAFSLDGRDAVTDALQDALEGVNKPKIALAMVFASYEYNIHNVLRGVMARLGDIPLIGFSTSGEITSEGHHRRSVVVVLVLGEDVTAQAAWFSGYSENSAKTTAQMTDLLRVDQAKDAVLFIVADGFTGDGEALLDTLPDGNYQAVGVLAGGDLRLGRTYQIAGGQAGTGGLAAAILQGGNLRIGTGAGHGWQPVGAYFKVTGTNDQWLRSLDDLPASESYANMFGRDAREWAFPPLNTLVRLYPLGFENANGNGDLTVRTPIRVETDGSLRMNGSVPDGVIGHVLIGGTEACLDAARKAATDALAALDGATPKFALVFADVSWEMLFRGQPSNEIDAVREVLGPDVPIAGGYTLGQLAPTNGSQKPEFLNQHIEVVVFGEASG